MRPTMIAWAVLLALAATLLAGAAAYMTGMPGRSATRTLAPLSGEEQATAERLRAHVAFLASDERTAPPSQGLERAARYIEEAFRLEGFTPRVQRFQSAGQEVRNIEVAIPEDAAPGTPALVIGAHYDTVPGTPGADDNASGVAALLELARLLRAQPPRGTVRLVAFAHEEPPYFMSEAMGSAAWAARARERGEPIAGMISLEMLGFYRDTPGSQRYPFPLGLLYPDRGDFIAFVGDLGSRSLVRRTTGAFRDAATIPSEGLAAPAVVPGVMWSDHWSFRQEGFAAVMVTDTAFFRNPHYHQPSDRPETLDYERMARVTVGLAAMARRLTAAAPT